MNVFRPTALLFSILALSSTLASAQSWINQAFPVKHHQFGDVARASLTEYRFPVHNPLDQTLHLQSVRASCGCTTATIENPSIPPGQIGYIHAKYNTDTHKGQKGATLTVVIDQPVYAEVRLRVDGYIRTDLVVHPGAINFGNVPQGEPAQQRTQLMYAGRNDWEIVDVKSNQSWLVPSLRETGRGGGRVNYDLIVTATADAPEGVFQDELILVTNDSNKGRVPVKVAGRIESSLTLSPKAIALGEVKPGEKVRQRIVLVGREPFTISEIQAEGWEVDFESDGQPKKTHILMAEFWPTGETTGSQKTPLQILAQGAASITATGILTAHVLAQ